MLSRLTGTLGRLIQPASQSRVSYSGDFSVITPSTVFPTPPTYLSAITPYATASEWFVGSMKRVGELRRLPDGWDSYGSPPISNDARRRAVQLLILLDSAGAPPPLVAPVSGGGLQIEWRVGPRSLELEVLPDGSTEFLRVYGDDKMVEGSMPADRTDYLREQVQWLGSTA